MIAPAAVLNQMSGSHSHHPRMPVVTRAVKKETTRDRHQKHSKIFPQRLSGYIHGPSSVPSIPNTFLNPSNICSEYSILDNLHVVNDNKITASSLSIQDRCRDITVKRRANSLDLLDLVSIGR